MASQHAIAKARCKALNLRFEAIGHIEGRSVRHVTVGPKCVLALWCAGWIEERWLRREHEWPFWMVPLQYQFLRLCDLVKRASSVHGDCAPARCRAPRHRALTAHSQS